jgi:undecaprenyl-diphosphatase
MENPSGVTGSNLVSAARLRSSAVSASGRRGLPNHWVLALLKTALGLVFLALFLRLAFSVPAPLLAGSASSSGLQSFDEAVLRFIGEHLRSPSWDFLAVDISSLGSLAVTVTLCVVSAALFLLSRDPAAAIHLGITAAGGFKIAALAKQFVDRPRPEVITRLVQVGGKSFPSGHAVTAAAIYLTLAILASRYFRSNSARVTLFVLAGLVIALVAFSRLYLGVHYPSDVLSGALLGAAWALFLGALFSRQHFVARAK